MDRVAVLGAGVMGRGIAATWALAGFQVGLVDVSDGALAAAVRGIEDDLALLREEGLASGEEVRRALALVAPTVHLDDALAGAGLVTETVPEVLEAKLELFERVERAIAPDAIVASNTSTFPVARLASRARRPGRFVVTHFFNPAHLVPLVEVVAHPAADAGLVPAVLDLLRRIGKTPVLLRKDVPGFVANRLQVALAREAFHLVEEGVVDAAGADLAVTAGPGFRWPFIGPLETADLGGLDTWQRVFENLAPELSRATGAPPLLAERVREGRLGAKTGSGIRSYEGSSLAERLRERDRRLARLLALRRRSG